MTEPEDATTGGPDSAPTVTPPPVTDAAPGVSPGLAARPSATGTSRISALDGLRAVALLIIMGYHFGVGWLQGGFFSLDIFYVLSGYLITGLLLSEYAKRGRIKLSAFWLRRARRLLPALLIVLVAVTLMVRFAEPAGLYPGFRLNALSALFYFSNWWQIHASGNYFVMTGATSPLTHTWSLAVEEQFYLVWPLVVLGVFTLARTVQKGITALLFVSGIGALASALEMAALYHPRANITRLYFGTDTHAQSILVGATMACALTLIQRKRGEGGMAPTARTNPARYGLILLGLLGFAGTFALTYLQGGTAAFDYQGGFFLSALSAAAIILGAVCVPSGPIAWTLSAKPLVWLGTISYGAYLWHYPVFIYLDRARTGTSGFPLLLIRFAVTFAFAAASYYLVERPVMYGTFWRSLKAIGPATVLLVATVAVVIAGTVSEASASPSVVPIPVHAVSGRTVPVLMEGDSTALTLGVALAYAAAQSHDGLNIIDQGIEGCGIAEGRTVVSNGTVGPMPAPCNPDAPKQDQWPALLDRAVVRNKPGVVILLAGRWEVYNRADLAGRITNITDPSYADYIESQLQHFVAIASAAGSRVVLMTAPYYDSGEQPNGQPQPQDQPVRVQDYNRLVRKVAAANPQTVSVVNLNPIVCPDGRFTTTVGHVTVRAPDGVHFPTFNFTQANAHAPDTAAQVKQFAGWIGPQVLPQIVAATHQ
jgi:peptidoglycan/LPS O-acetylase OafA/YrhL